MDSEKLNRPLFVGPIAEMEREDLWSRPQGFMLGGMALPTREDLSEQYFDAANVLIAAVGASRLETTGSWALPCSYTATRVNCS